MSTDVSTPAEGGLYVDDSRYESLNGELRERPLPGLEHAKLQALVRNLLLPFTNELGGEVLQEWTMVHGQDWLTPDVTFSFRDYRIDKIGRLIAPAYLCVEIRSPQQPVRDLFEKWGTYQQWKIPYCWIIDPAEKVCYECSAGSGKESPTVKNDVLRAGDITLGIRDLFFYSSR